MSQPAPKRSKTKSSSVARSTSSTTTAPPPSPPVVNRVYSGYVDFMRKHEITATQLVGATPTHSRMPGGMGGRMYPCKYAIPPEEMGMFCFFYRKHVLEEGNEELLTELRNPNVLLRNIVIDFDLRYDTILRNRQHTDQHLFDLVTQYGALLHESYDIPEGTRIDMFVFEKPNPVLSDDMRAMKDGIHMVVGMKTHKDEQLYLREKLPEKLEHVESWQHLIPLWKNTWEEVIDRGVITGSSGWMLYGSNKANCDKYELTHYYQLVIDEDGGGSVNELPFDDDFVSEQWMRFTPNWSGYSSYPMKTYISQHLSRDAGRLNHDSTKLPNRKRAMPMEAQVTDDDGTIHSTDMDFDGIISEELLCSITNQQQLVMCTQSVLDVFKEEGKHDYVILHDMVMQLSDKFYQPGSHHNNRMVAFALKHTDLRFFLTWVCLRARADDFEYDTIPDLYTEWQKFPDCNSEGKKLSARSIHHWLYEENPVAYRNLSYIMIENMLIRCTTESCEVNFAEVLTHEFGHRYACVNVPSKEFYHFKNHRWCMDPGRGLRRMISNELYALFNPLQDKLEKKKAEHFANKSDVSNVIADDTSGQAPTKDPVLNKIESELKAIVTAKLKLRCSNNKNNILLEAGEILFNQFLLSEMDNNPLLLGCENGVIDFKTKQFRDGLPDDYLTKSTKLNYRPLSEYESTEEGRTTIEEIHEFMRQLFPVPDLLEYMWDHLSSCLIGSNRNQQFNIYYGSGSNGKSLITTLMFKALGDYAGIVPVNLVTDQRIKIGAPSEEIMKLKGIRYAVLQEPTPGMKLNVGILKELTGGDKLTGRAMYKSPETFTPQFNLVVCANTLFNVESNDDGTWRRIARVDYLSKFCDPDETFAEEPRFKFPKDRTMNDKIPRFAPVFLSMLVDRAFANNGIVKMCETVRMASLEYRREQDLVLSFIDDHYELKPEEDLKHVEKYKAEKATNVARGQPKAKVKSETVNLARGVTETNVKNDLSELKKTDNRFSRIKSTEIWKRMCMIAKEEPFDKVIGLGKYRSKQSKLEEDAGN